MVFDDSVKMVKRNWKMTQLYAQRYWSRWVQEYLPELTHRNKWFDTVTPLEVGDVVLIIDNRYIRNCWLRGVVQSVRNKGGQVRSAVVKTKSGLLIRPVAKLAKLDIVRSCDLRSDPGSQVTRGRMFKNATKLCRSYRIKV